MHALVSRNRLPKIYRGPIDTAGMSLEGLQYTSVQRLEVLAPSEGAVLCFMSSAAHTWSVRQTGLPLRLRNWSIAPYESHPVPNKFLRCDDVPAFFEATDDLALFSAILCGCRILSKDAGSGRNTSIWICAPETVTCHAWPRSVVLHVNLRRGGDTSLRAARGIKSSTCGRAHVQLIQTRSPDRDKMRFSIESHNWSCELLFVRYLRLRYIVELHTNCT